MMVMTHRTTITRRTITIKGNASGDHILWSVLRYVYS